MLQTAMVLALKLAKGNDPNFQLDRWNKTPWGSPAPAEPLIQ
ncbi:MAG: hypothetical protein QY325_07375 [Flavobacteriales bacterium]|nr:MAG: hypothetical protein QY325_07375 [Flavobacteriales bacterium]